MSDKDCDCDECVLDRHQAERHKELMTVMTELVREVRMLSLLPRITELFEEMRYK